MKRHSLFLFHALLEISKQYDKRMSTLDFSHKVFSTILNDKMTEENVKESFTQLEKHLDFFDVQHLRVHLLYYLHQEPKGNAIPGVSYLDIVKKMMEFNVVNNREFLSKESMLLEKITSLSMYHEKLREIISALIFGHSLPTEKPNPSKQELLKQLEVCQKKLASLS